MVFLGLLDFPIKEEKSVLMTQLAAGVIWHLAEHLLLS